MTANVERRHHPVSLRLSEADIAIIDRAASRHGRSRTQFLRDAAVRAAEDALEDDRAVQMSSESFEDFLAALAGPATPVPEMVELLGRAAPWEAGKDTKAGR